jgi:hypothetical protein
LPENALEDEEAECRRTASARALRTALVLRFIIFCLDTGLEEINTHLLSAPLT